MEFSIDQLRELIAIVNQTDITEMTLESGDLRLSIRKSEKNREMIVPPTPTPPIEAMMAQATDSPPESPSSRKLIDIVSPMVGTFYRSPAPDDPPFVDIGDNIRKGQSVCIIEAMKLMNEIESESSGRIVEILVSNAQPVEYGQALMRIEVA
ncbi:MAG: acetyl-CoA carboxylase biotin carboxyl carrier protein [Oscillatoriales cyanobacterium SM2_2_1]|nr:acetyl-CoA carboxylase biotin carboxyl carrier protein [Oscillatoriales cyanobacterium SM2_2_1]